MSTTAADPAARRRSLAMISVAVGVILVASGFAPRPAGVAGVDPRLIGLYEGHVIELALAVVAIVALARGDLARWGFTRRGARSSLRSVAIFAVAYVPVIVVVTAGAALARGVRPSLGGALTAPDVLALVVFEAAFVGVAEEVLFRGLVQSYLFSHTSRSGLDIAMSKRNCHCFGPVFGAQFPRSVRNVKLDGLRGDAEFPPDLLACLAVRDKLDDLALSVAEAGHR